MEIRISDIWTLKEWLNIFKGEKKNETLLLY